MKENRNLIYPLPISEVNKERLMERMSFFAGYKIEKINLKSAAEYAGVIKALWEYRTVGPAIVNDQEIQSSALVAYLIGLPECLSFAFRQAHGIQRFEIEEVGKGNKPNQKYLFSITDVEFDEDCIILFGIAKNNNGKEKEYLIYWFLDNFEFYSSYVHDRKPRNRVFVDLSEKAKNRLSVILKYAYKYLKCTDEVMLSKLTELLTGERVKKPSRQLFVTLNRELHHMDIDDNRKELICQVLRKSFHRLVQTSRERQGGLFVQDSDGIFQLSIENIVPCSDKKGLRCQGLREFIDEPWKNYRINLEYDYKKNVIQVFDNEWLFPTSALIWEETPNNLKEIKNFRRCINMFYNSSK